MSRCVFVLVCAGVYVAEREREREREGEREEADMEADGQYFLIGV